VAGIGACSKIHRVQAQDRARNAQVIATGRYGPSGPTDIVRSDPLLKGAINVRLGGPDGVTGPVSARVTLLSGIVAQAPPVPGGERPVRTPATRPTG
jgi:hypothetical protein